MRLELAALALVLGWLAGQAAIAGETPCWLDRGVLVAPAALGDIAGDFIIDLSAPKSALHLTVAEAVGFDAPVEVATLRFAGVAIPQASFEVVSLNARTWGFPTNIVGVIGADALAPFVVDIGLKPCRLTLWPGRAPPLAAAVVAPIVERDGIPTIAAAVSDRRIGLSGWFAIDTGSAGVRISDRVAAYSRAPAGDDWAWRLDPPARLAALSLPDGVVTNVPAALQPGAPPGLLGGLGTDIWSRYATVRVDLPARRLELAPAGVSAAP